jgi:hypothetical protein
MRLLDLVEKVRLLKAGGFSRAQKSEKPRFSGYENPAILAIFINAKHFRNVS